jgi:peroxiredoxin
MVVQARRPARLILWLVVAATVVACRPAPTGQADPGAGPSELVTSGSVAPDFTLDSTDGSAFSLSESNGKVRLIDFWATWCKPCVEEIPMFKELQAAYGERGFTIVAISDEPSGVIREFVETHAIDYPNLIDPGDVAEQYGVLALPSAYLIDREGKVIETFQGPKPRRVLEARIVELLGGAGAT